MAHEHQNTRRAMWHQEDARFVLRDESSGAPIVDVWHPVDGRKWCILPREDGLFLPSEDRSQPIPALWLETCWKAVRERCARIGIQVVSDGDDADLS